MPAVKACPPEARLALVDLAVPALRLMSRPQWRAFADLVAKLVEADQRLDVFELALRRVLTRHVEPTFEGARPRTTAQYYSLKRRRQECSVVLSALAWRGGAGVAVASHASAADAFARGAAHLPGVDPELLPESSLWTARGGGEPARARRRRAAAQAGPAGGLRGGDRARPPRRRRGGRAAASARRRAAVPDAAAPAR